jgi:hypothetical protein
MASKVDLIEECRRKNSVVVSRLKEKRSEGYLDTGNITKFSEADVDAGRRRRKSNYTRPGGGGGDRFL